MEPDEHPEEAQVVHGETGMVSLTLGAAAVAMSGSCLAAGPDPFDEAGAGRTGRKVADTVQFPGIGRSPKRRTCTQRRMLEEGVTSVPKAALATAAKTAVDTTYGMRNAINHTAHPHHWP